MKKVLFLPTLTCLLIMSCSIQEPDALDASALYKDVLYAELETYSEPATRVYVVDNIKILWDADDRISVFDKYTYNQEYRINSDAGTTAGKFVKVPNDDFVVGNNLDFVYAVYPYLESTKISNTGILTLTFPSEQTYRKGSFGPSANTMVSATKDDLLKFKNAGGYLLLKFYGKGISVSSITLEGKNGEKLSGTATVKAAVGDVPVISMEPSKATASITLTSDKPVELDASKENATVFWMVVPPTNFEKGFTLTVNGPKGEVFVKDTDKNLSVVRNTLQKIAPIEVKFD